MPFDFKGNKTQDVYQTRFDANSAAYLQGVSIPLGTSSEYIRETGVTDVGRRVVTYDLGADNEPVEREVVPLMRRDFSANIADSTATTNGTTWPPIDDNRISRQDWQH